MSLSADAIDKVAKLAKINITDNHHAELEQQLNDILELVEQLKGADTDNVKPLAHPLDQTQPLRQDSITESNQWAELQANAPDTDNDLFIVPQVIEDA